MNHQETTAHQLKEVMLEKFQLPGLSPPRKNTLVPTQPGKDPKVSSKNLSSVRNTSFWSYRMQAVSKSLHDGPFISAGALDRTWCLPATLLHVRIVPSSKLWKGVTNSFQWVIMKSDWPVSPQEASDKCLCDLLLQSTSPVVTFQNGQSFAVGSCLRCSNIPCLTLYMPVILPTLPTQDNRNPDIVQCPLGANSCPKMIISYCEFVSQL